VSTPKFALEDRVTVAKLPDGTCNKSDRRVYKVAKVGRASTRILKSSSNMLTG